MVLHVIMFVGIVHYPGSNCMKETIDYFESVPAEVRVIQSNHDNISQLDGMDLLVLPGGFAYGDRVYDKATESYTISPGTMAVKCPVSRLIKHAAGAGIAILGICNGFQILTQLGLLPGTLELNDSGRFECCIRECAVPTGSGAERTVDLWIANSYGKYVPSKESRYNAFLWYDNGDVAGIWDREARIFGMMPHPERTHGISDHGERFKSVLMSMLFPSRQEQIDAVIQQLMQSEHISYKSTKKYLRDLHVTGSHVVQGPGENAGIVRLGGPDSEWCLAIRIESHNHPTYINPFEGAATGVGGILRDIFTMGARPIAIMDFLRFGLDDHSQAQLEEAMNGISYYGNCVGVPNIGGDLRIHETYSKNPLVNVMAMGLVRERNVIRGKANVMQGSQHNTSLVYVGAKTGMEGINGAAMASQVFRDDMDKDAMQSNVQKSDPFLEKLLLEACCELAERDLVIGMQDMGAGGLLCASIEMLQRGGGAGCVLDLDNVPTKCAMSAEDILASESQERMLIACSGQNYPQIAEIFRRWDLEHHVIGQIDNTGIYTVKQHDSEVYRKNLTEIDRAEPVDWLGSTLAVPREREPFSSSLAVDRQLYDCTVGNRTIRTAENDRSAVIDVPEANGELHVSYGETFGYCLETLTQDKDIEPLCVVNCLNYGNPKSSMKDLVENLAALNKGCKEHDIPIVGGNVSLYNSTDDTDIIPTPIYVMVGFKQNHHL